LQGNHNRMKKYELMTIANIKLGEEGARDLSNTIKDAVTDLSGKVLDSEFWGKRKFAYLVNNEEEGFYEVLQLEMPPAGLIQLKDKLNLQDNLVRYLIVTTGK
jgi:small subunit ribosomal protein S6